MNISSDPKYFEARQPNWLPLPIEESYTLKQFIVDDDFFPKGDVTEFYPQQGLGSVTEHRGIKLSFNLDEVELIGEKGSDAISVGIKVGYDLARTSGGNRITKLKIY